VPPAGAGDLRRHTSGGVSTLTVKPPPFDATARVVNVGHGTTAS
jgi:hypothetical protein